MGGSAEICDTLRVAHPFGARPGAQERSRAPSGLGLHPLALPEVQPQLWAEPWGPYHP